MRRALIVVLGIALALPLVAAETTPTKRQRELVRELLQLTLGGGTATNVLDVMLAQAAQQYLAAAEAKGYIEKDVEKKERLYALFREEVAGIDVPQAMEEAAIAIYARHFTERELGELVAFHRTPTGRKSIQLLPEILRESSEAGARYLTPLLDEAGRRASRRYSAERTPWKGTMSDLRVIATAVLAYSVDRDDLKLPPGDFKSLEKLLVPEYLSRLPKVDTWGTPLRYVASADGQHFRLASAGADRKFEAGSLVISGAEGQKLEYGGRLKDDIVSEDGIFVQLPVEAAPKDSGM